MALLPFQVHSQSRRRRHSQRGSLAEFGPALFIFFFFALFPLIDLLGVAVGASTIALAARQAASGAASSTDYTTAVNAMYREGMGVANSGFGKFVNLQPVNGYNGSGMDLWVVQTNFQNKQIQYCGANKSCPAPIDQTNFVYEYEVVAQYRVGPLCNLGAIPIIGSVPGLGQPATIRYIGNGAVEYPDGLSAGAGGAGISLGSWSAAGP